MLLRNTLWLDFFDSHGSSMPTCIVIIITSNALISATSWLADTLHNCQPRLSPTLVRLAWLYTRPRSYERRWRRHNAGVYRPPVDVVAANIIRRCRWRFSQHFTSHQRPLTSHYLAPTALTRVPLSPPCVLRPCSQRISTKRRACAVGTTGVGFRFTAAQAPLARLCRSVITPSLRTRKTLLLMHRITIITPRARRTSDSFVLFRIIVLTRATHCRQSACDNRN